MRNPLKKILYVEDDKDIQSIVKIALEKINDYELVISDSGAQALEALKNYTPDLLLLDVMMPQMDGPSLLNKIQKQENLKKIPHIFMTAKVHPNDIASLMSQGALSVIAKPFDPVELGNEIQRIWDQAYSENNVLDQANT